MSSFGTRTTEISSNDKRKRERGSLRARLIDELHIDLSPVLLGSGERPFEGIDLRARNRAAVH